MPIDADERARREAIVREHMGSENEKRFDDTMATFTHPRYELIATGDVFDGKEAVAEYFRASRALVPDQRNELIALHHADDAVIVEFWLRGTPVGATPFECRMTAFFFFAGQGGGIVCERVYWDRLSIARIS
jgi:ketosteroid isomerase-like protein